MITRIVISILWIAVVIYYMIYNITVLTQLHLTLLQFCASIIPVLYSRIIRTKVQQPFNLPMDGKGLSPGHTLSKSTQTNTHTHTNTLLVSQTHTQTP